MDRRDFLKQMGAWSGGAALTLTGCDRFMRDGDEEDGSHSPPEPITEPASGSGSTEGDKTTPSTVALVRTDDRASGVKKALAMLDIEDLSGKRVFLKPNYNSADPTPGSTHNDALSALVDELQRRDLAGLTVGDRSGMGKTRSVMEQKGLFQMAEEKGFEAVVFDDLPADRWQYFQFDGSHWSKGFAFPKPVTEADAIIQTCCLKTHRYGGVFTMSLKNSVGFAAKRVPGDPHDYMRELHNSPHQRRMIAEINQAYRPALVVMDGVEAFTSGGPASGERVHPGVIIAGTDRVAIDAIGVAILRHYGTTPDVERGEIYDLDQLARAAELKLGAPSPGEFDVVTDDPASAEFWKQIEGQLRAG